MGCCHCLVDAHPEGAHMSWDTFVASVAFQVQLEQQHAPAVLMLSGGEPTEHPQLLEMLEYLDQLPQPAFDTKMVKVRRMVFLLSNGLFLSDDKLREEVFRHDVLVQVTNDARFYPQRLPPHQRNWQEHWSGSRLCIEEHLRMLVRLGRAKNPYFAPLAPGPEIEWRKTPMCFNLRSATGYYRSLPQALAALGKRGYWCSPSINVDGSIVAGEAPSCTKIGDVTENPILIGSRLCAMTCARCGLVHNLNHQEKRAINEAMIELIRGDL
jgi:hypothetical protein